jgi:hypothetical protein
MERYIRATVIFNDIVPNEALGQLCIYYGMK